jgi:hypothetical protein
MAAHVHGGQLRHNIEKPAEENGELVPTRRKSE